MEKTTDKGARFITKGRGPSGILLAYSLESVNVESGSASLLT